MNIADAKKELKIAQDVNCSEQLIQDSYDRLYNDITNRIANAINNALKIEYQSKLISINEAKSVLLSTLNTNIDIDAIPSRDANRRVNQSAQNSAQTSDLGQPHVNYEKVNKYFFGIMILGLAAASYFGIKMNAISKELENLKPVAEKNQRIVHAISPKDNELVITNKNSFAISIAEMNVSMIISDSIYEIKNFGSEDVNKDNGILQPNAKFEPTYKAKNQSKRITNWIQVNIVGIDSGNGQCYSKTYNSKDVENGNIELNF